MKTFLPLLFLLSFYNNLFSQTPCGVAGDEPPGCFMCTNTYTGSNAGYTQGIPGPTFPCGSVENNLWISMMASNENIALIVTVGDCVQDQGLQLLLYDENLVPVSTCLSTSAIGPGQTGSVTASGLTPGAIYLFMVDGLAADVCDFSLTAVGIATAGPPAQTPAITGPSRVCPGDIATFSLAASLPGQVTYNWSIPSGAQIISGQGTEEITVKFNSSGTGIIQVNHEYTCVTGIPAAPFPVDFLSIPPTILPPAFHCREDFPVVIDGNQFNQAGNYVFTFLSIDGCDSLVTYNILSYPNTTEFVNATICQGDTFYLNNEPYYETGSYRQVFGNAAVSGCDSSIDLSLTVIDPSISIDQPDNLDCLPNATVTLNVTGTNLPNTGVHYQWSASNGGNIISGADTPQPVVDAAGTYTVLVEVTINNLPCTQQASVDVFRNGAPGQPIIDTAANFLCRGDTGFYFIEPLPDADTTFWYFGTEDTLAFTIDTGFHYVWPATGGKFWVRIQGKNECGLGPVTDTLIEILPLNKPDLFNLRPDTICLSDSIFYTWNPNYPGADSLIWNIPGGNLTNLPGDNFSIRWANPGVKFPRLILQNGSCFSDIFVDTILVDAPLPPPAIVCNAQTDQVTFSWAVPPGVTSQNINLLSGPSGTSMGNSYLVTGLNPGDEVSIEVIFEGNSICGPSRDTAVCIAQNCPPITLSIEAVPPICLDNSNGPIQMNYMTTGGTGNGTATWSGPGVTDPSGVFLPSMAGPGTHTILLVYEENGCTYDTTTTIELVRAPIADFSYNVAVCLLDNVLVDFTGVASPQATYTWNFDGAQILSGSGPGPYELQFNTAGSKNISLEIQDGGCLSNLATATIQVDDALSTPVISCQSTSPTEVLFSWNNVPGATDYVVNVLTLGITGFQSGNTFVVDNLLPETQVEIEVTAISTNLCPSTSARITCISQACPTVSVTIIPIAAICEGDENQYPLDATIMPFNNGTVTWSGNGVSTGGVLDPSGLPPGQQQVTVRYEEGPCIYQASATYDILPAPIVTDSIQQPIFYGLGGTGNIDLEVQGNSPFTYLWNDGATTSDRPDLVAGIYCVTVADNNGCTTENCYVAGSGLYRVSPIHIICKGDGKRLSVRPNRGADFSWRPARGLSCTDCPDPIASPNQSTIYTLTITLPDGRRDSIDIYVLVIPPPFCPNAREIEEIEVAFERMEGADMQDLDKLISNKLESNHELKLYPNPTDGKVVLQSNEIIERVEILDLTGRVLQEIIANQKQIEFSLADYPTGLYLVSVLTEKGIKKKWLMRGE